MRGMRPCATASAIFLGLTLCVVSFAACSSGSAPSAGPGVPGAESPPPAEGPASEGPASSPQASPAGAAQGESPGAAAPSRPKKAPETLEDCKVILSEITNTPPQGAVVMNNASPGPDGGPSDRLQPILETVTAKRDGFRCCFDIYARKNPGARGRIALTMKLDPEGKLMEAKIKQDESDVTAPQVESCMAELAKSITWPRSPRGMDTTYTHRFDFKPRR
jgi:hypothetical protein